MHPQGKVSVTEYLSKVREQLGEDAWKAEITRLALQGFKAGGSHEDFWRDIIKDFDWINAEDLLAQIAAAPEGPPDVEQLLAEAMKQTMPSCKSQAQFTTFRAAFDAFRQVMDAIFMEDATREEESKKILDMGYAAARQATELTRQLRDVPEAATSKEADEFKKPPAEFQEYDVQKQLLAELAAIGDNETLRIWYTETRTRRDSVKSQTLRNVLMDAIRNKKLSFGEGGATA